MDAFLDWSPRCTVVKVCALGSSRLLQRVLAREPLESADSVKRDPRFRQWQFECGMLSAVALGNLELVQSLGTHFCHFGVSLEVIETAVSHGRLEILKWLYPRCPDIALFYSRDVRRALRGGHFAVAKWLQTKQSLCNEQENQMRRDYANSAAKSDILEWARIAAEIGSLEMVKWAYGQIASTLDASESAPVVTAAVNDGHLDILVWLFENICGDRPCFSVCLTIAIYSGHLNVIEWMLRNQPAVCRSLDSMAVIYAACYGRLDMLRLLHAYKVDISSTDAMDYAASNGHLDTIRWLHANNFSGCTHSAMDGASAGGFLDIVQWLHEKRSEGCSVYAMDWAATRGHMKVLQWLAANRSEGCTSYAVDDAASNGHLDTVKWLHGNRNEGCTSRAMDGAAMNGDLEVVKWLHVHRTEGCTVGAMDYAAKSGHLEVVQWLHVNRTEGCTTAAMDEAAANGHLEVVQWLHANRQEGCTSSTVRHAICCGKWRSRSFFIVNVRNVTSRAL